MIPSAGGRPLHVNGTANTTPADLLASLGNTTITSFVHILNGATALDVSFEADPKTYFTLPANATLALPARVSKLWVRSATTSPYQALLIIPVP